jgi:hypothetical protein
LIDGQPMTPGRLATAAGLPPAALDATLLDLELAGLVRRTAAGVQAINLPSRVASPGPAIRGPPGGGPAAEVLERGGSDGDDDGDD